MPGLAGLLAALLAVACSAASTVPTAAGNAPSDSASIPLAAKQAGFTHNTYHVANITASQIDFGQKLASGKKLYFWNLWGCRATDSEAKLPGNGTVELVSHCGPSATLMSGMIKPGSPGYVGTAFGGGGYFEAEIAYDPALATKLSYGWPAWWTMSAEHLWALPAAKWPRQAAVDGVPYEHFIEPDIFEAQVPTRDNTSYAASVHEWYGAYGKTCRNFCSFSSPQWVNLKSAPPGNNWAAWHELGMLWVPATSSKPGSLTFFLDNVRQGAPLTWKKYDARRHSPPIGSLTPWRFGVIDDQHLVLIVGSGRKIEGRVPLRVRSINVWQASAAHNLSS